MASRKNVNQNSDTAKSPNLSSLDPSFEIVDTFQSLYKKQLLDAGESVQLKNIILKDWVDDLTAQNEAIIRSLKAIETDVSKKSSGSQKCQEVESLTTRLTELNECVDSLRRSICEKDAQISRVMREASQFRDQCEKQNVSLQSQEATINENTALKAELVDLKCCLRKKECHIQEIMQQLSEVTSRLCAQEEEVTREAMNKLDYCARIEQMQEELGSLKRDNDEKEESLKNYCRRFTAMKQTLAEAERHKKESDSLQNEVIHLREELAQKSCALEKAKSHIKELRSSNYGLSNPGSHSNNSSGLYSPQGKFVQDFGGSGDSSFIALKQKLENQKDLQKALIAEVAEKHDTIISLKEQIHELEEKLRQTEIQAHFKDDIIRELRKEVKLGRAKESLAEMLGLKEGPRVQMKARIDRLNSELEDKMNEVSRLNSLINNSSLAKLENRVKVLTLDLESRDRKMLTMCDKLDYIRSYLLQLKTEEQVSIKCGLEALITELNDDLDNTREERRNILLSLDREPNDKVIIINHRSHSLPDSALQHQVHNFQVSSKCSTQNNLHGVPHRSKKFVFEDLSKLKQLGSSLGNSQTNLGGRCNAVNQAGEGSRCNEAELREFDSAFDRQLSQSSSVNSDLEIIEELAERLKVADSLMSGFASTDESVVNEHGEETASYRLKDSSAIIENKEIFFRNLMTGLSSELNGWVTQVIQRAQKIFQNEKWVLLCKTLDQTQNELEVAMNNATFRSSVQEHPTLMKSLAETAGTVEILLKEVAEYMEEMETMEALCLKKERSFSTLMVTLKMIVEDMAKKDEEMIHALTEELKSIKGQYEDVQLRLLNVMEEKDSMKAENERALDELQMKVIKLQETLQEEKSTSPESVSDSAHDVQTAFQKLKEQFIDDLKFRDDEIEVLRRELEASRDKLSLSELEIEKLELHVQEYKKELDMWVAKVDQCEEAVSKTKEEDREVELCSLERVPISVLQNLLIRKERGKSVEDDCEKMELPENDSELKDGALKQLKLELKNSDESQGQEKYQSYPESSNVCESLEEQTDLSRILAGYEKTIFKLLEERSHHVLMMKRMRNFTCQLSKFCPHGDSENECSELSCTTCEDGSSLYESSVRERDGVWFQPEGWEIFE